MILCYLIVFVIEKFGFIICFGFRASDFGFLNTIMFCNHLIDDFPLVGNDTAFNNLVF